MFLNLKYAGSENCNIDFSNFIFKEIRLPKTISCIAAGIGLPIAGLILQIIFRNPLAGPYVLGISSGAGLMLALVTLTPLTLLNIQTPFFGKSIIVFASITGSIAATILILLISKKIKSNVLLLLVGIMIAQICGALQSILEFLANPSSLKNFIVFNLGNLSLCNLNESIILLSLILLCLVVLFFYTKTLNAFLFGEKYATNLGFNYNKNRFTFILITSVITGIITAFCGPIAFIGIAIPILSRWLISTSHQGVQIISSAMLGCILLLLCDLISHTIIANSLIPINTITSIVGSPIVITLLFKSKTW